MWLINQMFSAPENADDYGFHDLSYNHYNCYAATCRDDLDNVLSFPYIITINREIRGIVIKTVGITDVLKKALEAVEKDIELGFIYGSSASGDYRNESDVDLLIVSELSGLKLAELLGPVQNEIGRSINISQFTPAEYDSRKRQNDHFLTRVLDGPKIRVFGRMNES